MGIKSKKSKSVPITLGIIGMGYTGQQHYHAAKGLSEIEVLGVSDLQETPGFELGETRFYKDWRELLKIDQIEAISICLPHYLHAQTSIECLQAGKHVLLEKPLASNLEEAQLILKEVEKVKSVFMVEMTHRFYMPIKSAKEIIDSGKLGEILA